MNEAQPFNALPRSYRLQEYELKRVLGFGGFGMTYLGFDHNLEKDIAIKEYLPLDIATRTGGHNVIPQASQFREDFEWGLASFLAEARTLARFNHRHIIKVYRFFEAHGTAYIVMEYAEGETLSDFLNRKGVLNEAELQAILYPLLAGLEVVHGADFLHRDIKPGNIIIRSEDISPVLLDFGAARQAIGSRSRSVTSILTPGYAPIEQYSSRGNQGPWTDIYALGGVCYSALTGEVPDDATDRVRNDPLVPLVDRCAGQASAEFLSAIDWALSVDEGDRPQSIGAWRVALGEETPRIVDTQPSVPASAPAPQAEKARQELASSEKQRREAAKFVGEVGRKPSPSGVDDKGTTDLHFAASLNLDMIARSLLDQGADVNAKTTYGKATPLHDAAKNKARETAEVLLNHGADVHPKNSYGRTPLHEAARSNAREIAEVLLKKGADVHPKNRIDDTPLHDAAKNNARETAEVLLKHGADIHAENKDGWTPLVAEEEKFVAEVGRKPSASGMDDKGTTDLHIAASLNLNMLTRSLLNQGADVNAKITYGKATPLHEAAKNNARETAELLLNHGADVHPTNSYGRTPLHEAAKNKAHETAEVLLKHGADVHAKNRIGDTPLHEAAKNKAHETVEVLLKYGADVHAENNDGWTPLHRAERKDVATAEVLLKHGADVQSEYNEGNTLLHVAAVNDDREMAEVLLKHGADVHAENNYGNTPLHVAADNNARTTAEVLLDHGADVQAKGNDGRTPLHWAERNNARATAEVLLKHGADVHAEDNRGWTPLNIGKKEKNEDRIGTAIAIVLFIGVVAALIAGVWWLLSWLLS